MPPGKRQSPFIGKLVARDGILYPRYTSFDDILLEPASGQTAETGNKARKEKAKRKASAAADTEAPAFAASPEARQKKRRKSEAAAEADAAVAAEPPAVEAPASAAAKKLRKKQRKEAAGAELANGHAERHAPAHRKPQEAQEGRDAAAEQPAVASPAAADAGAPEPAAKRKKEKKGKKAAKRIAVPSGPGNEQQAQQMRSILGLPVAGQAAAQPSTAAGFSFGFAPDQAASAEEADEEAEEATGAPGKAAAAPAVSAAVAAEEEEDPELRARLRRVMGQGPELVPRRVFVGGMPFHYDEAAVREYWSYCGEIEELDLLRFPDTGRFRGIAFVTFADEAGYAEALKCDGEMIDEQQLKVKPCTVDAAKRGRGEREAPARDARRHHSEPAPKTPGYHVAYVGNVAFEASSTQLRDLFEGCSVSFVRLHTDKASGKSKGYAHVHFADEASLDRALDFDGTPFMGREIKVGYAQPKKA